MRFNMPGLLSRVLKRTGIWRSALDAEQGLRLGKVAGRKVAGHRPRVLIICDKPNWSYDAIVQGFTRELRGEFQFFVKYADLNPVLDNRYDLVYQCFWGERFYRKFRFDPERLLKGLASHRWEDDPLYGPCRTPENLVRRYLSDAAAVLCTSSRLEGLIKDIHPGAVHVPNGIDTDLFHKTRDREGELCVGWAGNPQDAVKGFADILVPACEGLYKLKRASNLRHKKMNDFYNSLDVLAIASTHEGEPLTLLEGMAAGCFLVTTDVGVARELIESGRNGLIVQRSVDAFRDAFAWCAANLEFVREQGANNAAMMRSDRNWKKCGAGYRDAFLGTLRQARVPRFRNDDVGGDTDLGNFKEICSLFHRHGFVQTHGITLRGRTVPQPSGHTGDLEGVEYSGHSSIGKMPNEQIRRLSADVNLTSRPDLIDFLNASPDQIALHGLYHTDYSVMTAEEQRREIADGLAELDRLFPRKMIKYFIPPFNRTNDDTYAVCEELGLSILSTDGIHLEERIENTPFVPGAWYRYHHHRFYPGSAFRYRCHSLSQIDECLSRMAALNQNDNAQASGARSGETFRDLKSSM